MDQHPERTTENMAKVTMNQLLEVLRGRIGGLVFRQRPDGRTIISGAPRYRKGKATPKQKAHRERFKDAVHYARWAAKLHPVYGELAEGTWKSAYNFALSDWFEAPVIHRIERREGRVLVEASDNIRVTRVQVSVLDEQGTALEKGEAIRGEGNWWEFASQSEGKTIVAEARDLAEHVTRFVSQ
jgi:hypothetical protein